MLRRGGGGGVRGVLRPAAESRRKTGIQNHAHTRDLARLHIDTRIAVRPVGVVGALHTRRCASPSLYFLLYPQAIATVLLGSTLGALCAVAALMLVDRFLQQTHGLDTA